MSTISEMINDMNSLMLQGKAIEAFEKYYAEDVSMQENENPPTVGKAANREREQAFFSGVTEFRGATIHSVAVGDNVSMVESTMDYTHKDYGVRKATQVAVQKWKDGKIVHEKFYYGA
jgi:ketosteroid isomerase-like protein